MTLTNQLLEKNREANRIYGMGIGWNHIPMVLIALDKLGANDNQIQEYFAGRMDQKGREPLESPQLKIERENWQGHLGKLENFLSYLKFFESEIENHGFERVLKYALPVLCRGIAASAYHSQIRLAFAVDHNDSKDMAFALADWAANFLASPAYDEKATAIGPGEQLSRIIESTKDSQVEMIKNITDRMEVFYGLDEFVSEMRPIKQSDGKPLREIATVIAEAFTNSQHFTLLHGVTSCHALRVLLPFIEDVKSCVTWYFHSICAAYLTVEKSKFPVGSSVLPDDEMSWQQIDNEAVASMNQHTIKMAYTCRAEESFYGEKYYKQLAAREIQSPAKFM